MRVTGENEENSPDNFANVLKALKKVKKDAYFMKKM